jgi:oligoribonuclease NrnB/cAMP/cGMP phosphodiesterase (DHH superfamily)
MDHMRACYDGPMTPIGCIYHKNCIDGTAAAAVVLRKFPSAHCFPVGHSNTEVELREIFEKMDPAAHLYIVDTVHGIDAALARGQTVTVLDHHISEYERVSALAATHGSLEYVFDNTKSGASLAWAYFFEDEPLPTLLGHVEDIDLWLGKFGEKTEYASNYLSLFRNDPAEVRDLFSSDIEPIYESGKLLTRQMRQEVERFLEFTPVPLSIGPYTVPAFNITNHQSHCGKELSVTHGSAVALYTIRGENVRFSFRSHDDQTPSALDLAAALGGGGHRNAAGAAMATQDFISNLRL